MANQGVMVRQDMELCDKEVRKIEVSKYKFHTRMPALTELYKHNQAWVPKTGQRKDLAMQLFSERRGSQFRYMVV